MGGKVGQEVNELYELVNITPVFQWKLALSWWCSGAIAIFMSLTSLMENVNEIKEKLDASCSYQYI